MFKLFMIQTFYYLFLKKVKKNNWVEIKQIFLDNV